MLNDRKDNWIAVDWGTSNMRVWLMSGDEVMAAKSSDMGMSKLNPDQFEATLIDLISDWLDSFSEEKVCVVACGMVGARQGWLEAPYAPTPSIPLAKFVKPSANDSRLDVYILSGLKSLEPHDVMRGEETQIAGFVEHNQEYTGLICMPGTHSKWVELEGGEVKNFTTMMTGEMYNMLCEHSVLSPLVDKSGRDEASFEAGLRNAGSTPDMVLNKIFSVRARAVLEGQSKAAAAAYLSGILIGTEVAAMKRQVSFENLKLMGSGVLGDLYSKAFELLDRPVEIVDVTDLTITGLIKARNLFAKVN